ANLRPAQPSRDGICGGSNGSPCAAANASVAAAQSAVDTAAAQLDAGQKVSAQQLGQAQAQLQAAQSLLANDSAHWNATIASARSQLAQAGAPPPPARRASKDARAKATATAQSGQGQVDQGGAVLAAARASYDQTVAPPTRAALDAAGAQVAAARAALAAAQADFDAATLRAPFAGTIASVNGAVGMWVSGGAGGSSASGGGSTGLIQLLDLSQLQIIAQVNEADMVRLRDGDPVTFMVSALPGQTFGGRVSGIQPQGTSSQNVVLYSVTIAVDRGAGDAAPLLPGMTASVHVATDPRTNAVVVPVAALAFAQSGGDATAPAAAPTATGPSGGTPATVLVLVDGHPVARPILVGLSNGRVAEVLGGVSVGDAVVT